MRKKITPKQSKNARVQATEQETKIEASIEKMQAAKPKPRTKKTEPVLLEESQPEDEPTTATTRFVSFSQAHEEFESKQEEE